MNKSTPAIVEPRLSTRRPDAPRCRHRRRRRLLPLILSAVLWAGHAASLRAQVSPATPVVAAQSHQLRPLDKLLFSIQEDPVPGAQPDEVIVNALGEAAFRITRGSEAALTLPVAGRTLEQVRAELEARLLADYYHRATIGLRLKETSVTAGKVLFSGAVRANFAPLLPGEQKTLFEGLLQVGLSDFANLRKVRLSRWDPASGREVSWTIDAEAIRKDRTKDVLLADGDRVDVPQKGINF
jgi:protein involved in polysaccharide export with SLBB domain